MKLGEYYEKLQNLKDYRNDKSVDMILDKIRKNDNFAFARFNDGEMMGVDKIGSTVARGDQQVNKSLHEALIKSLKHKQKNYIVGIPCSVCFPKYYHLAKNLVNQDKSQVIRAVALTNRNWAKFIVKFPEVAEDKKILWISGDDQKLDFLRNNMGLNIVGHLKYQAKDSWAEYGKLLEDYKKIDEKYFDTVMVSLGPTARIFVQQMFAQNNKKTYIDIGSTYDPFTRNVWHKCHLGWENGFNVQKNCIECN